MGRVSLFNSPLLLGFEHFERTLDSANRAAADGYPPYNILKIADDALRISLAVAGFAREDLSIVLEENQLVIRGRQSKEEDRIYIHRGIAARQFQRAFVLADGIEVEGAALENGLLNVDLIRPKPATVARSIEIKSAADFRESALDSDIAVNITDEIVSSASMSDEAVD
jgi:HSP20 family molecular chaperone IbpA